MSESRISQKKGTNSYFTHMAVASSSQASILANEHTWSILEVLRGAGAIGMTPREVIDAVEQVESIRISRSKIYSLLKRLYELEWVHRYYDIESKSQRNTIADISGLITMNDDFVDVIEDKMGKYVEKNLFPFFREFFEKTLESLSDDPKTKRWLPDKGSDSFCKKCHSNHEAEEFFDCVLNIASEIYFDSREFPEFMGKNKYQDELRTRAELD